MTSSGAKSDPVDADLILDYLEKHRDQLHEWKPDDELTRQIQILCEQRRGWVNDRTRYSNRMNNGLKGYYPQAIELLNGTLHTPLACDFLEKWPTLESLQRAKPHTIRKFFYAHNVRRPERIEEVLEQIRRAQPLTTDRAIVATSALEVQGLVRQLRQLGITIAACEKQLEELFSQHEDAEIFRSLPGAGEALAPRLLAAYGTDRDRFPTAASMQTLSGIAPVTVGSGTRKDRRRKKGGKKQRKFRVQRRYACPKFLRQTFHEFAQQSILQSAWARAYYNMLRDHGASYHAAVRALAFKWIRIITRLWKDRKTYDEATYMASLRRRNAPLLAYLPDVKAAA
jgi:transposase